MNDAITQAKQIDDQAKEAGFYQEAVDFIARQGFANARFEMDVEEGLDVVDEFYPSEEVQQSKAENTAFSLQQGLQGSVTALN